jgi:uncharacterized membrane protein YfcA
MLTVLPPKTVVPVVLILSYIIHFLILLETRKWIDLRRVWPLMIAGILVTPLGTYLLLVMNENTLKVFIGAITVLTATGLLAGFKRPIENEKLALGPVGAASGLLHGSTGMGGPPTILFFSNQGTEKQVFRANLTLFFTLLSLTAVTSQVFGGLLTKEILTYCVWFLPAMLLGVFTGVKLAHRASEAVFRKITLTVVGLTGLTAVISGLGIFA